MDERMRKIEREASGGDVEAGAKLLAERIRSGEVSRGRVELAFFLGDERSRLALGEGEQPVLDRINNREDLANWVMRIRDISDLEKAEGHRSLVRACVAASRSMLPIFEKALPDDIRPRESLDEIELWLLSEDEKCSIAPYAGADEAAGDAALASESAVDPNDRANLNAAFYAANSIAFAGQFAADYEVGGKPPDFINSFQATFSAYSVDDRTLSDGEKSRMIQDSIRTELLPWALGEGDPVKERVEARKKNKE